MKVIIADAVEVAPKEGTIIRFEDRGLVVIGIYVGHSDNGHTLELDMGPSCPNPGIRRQLDAKGEPYMCTSDLTTWIGIDGDWYRIYKPSITLEWPGILELAETEDELLDYLEDVSEFTRNEKGNN